MPDSPAARESASAGYNAIPGMQGWELCTSQDVLGQVKFGQDEGAKVLGSRDNYVGTVIAE